MLNTIGRIQIDRVIANTSGLLGMLNTIGRIPKGKTLKVKEGFARYVKYDR